MPAWGSPLMPTSASGYAAQPSAPVSAKRAGWLPMERFFPLTERWRPPGREKVKPLPTLRTVHSASGLGPGSSPAPRLPARNFLSSL